MADFSLWIYNEATAGAGQRITISFQPGADEVFVVTHWGFESTGAFRILDIRDSSGNHYLSDQSGKGIPSGLFAPTEFPTVEFARFEPPIEIGPLGILYVDVQDASGAPNTIGIFLKGIRRKG